MTINKVGKLNSADISQLKGGVQKKDLKKDKNLESIFNAADKDNNGILTDKEIQDFKQQLDTNTDNTVDKNELKKFAKENNVNRQDVLDFLNFIGENTENIESTLLMENDAVQITYKDGTQKTINPDQSYSTTITKDNTTTTTEFNTEGKKTQVTTQKEGENAVTEKFDNDGNLIQRTNGEVTELFENGILTQRKIGQNTTEYIENGKVTRKETDAGNGLKNVEKYTYDENKNLTQAVLSKADGSTQTTQFDEEGNVTSKTTVNGNITTVEEGNITLETDNSTGNVKQTTFNSDGTSTVVLTTENGKAVTEYNADGHAISQTKINNDGTTSEIQYSGDGCTVITVQNGESPAAIAKKFGCTVQELFDLNPDKVKGKAPHKYFLVGAQIKVPGTLDPDDERIQNRKSAQESKEAFRQDEMERVSRRIDGRNTKKIRLSKDYKNVYDFAKERLKQKGIQNPTNAQINDEANDLLALNSGVRAWKKGTEITVIMTEEESKKAAEDAEKESLNKAQQQRQLRENAKNIATELYNIVDDKHGKTSMNEMMKVLNNKVTPDNVVAVLDAYKNMGDDSSIIDSIMGENAGDARKPVLQKLWDNLEAAARKAGVSESDIADARLAFKNAYTYKYDSKDYRIIDMENAVDFMRGAIIAKQNGTTPISYKDAMSAVGSGFKDTHTTANQEFEDARAEEGWAAKTGDWVCGQFGCRTVSDMRKMLGKNSQLADKLIAAAQKNDGGKEFRKVYYEAFGIDFDPNKIAARNEYADKVEGATQAKSTVDICNNLLRRKNTPGLEAQIKNDMKLTDSDISLIKESYRKNYPSMSDNEILTQFLKEAKTKAQNDFNEFSGGKTLDQMQEDMDLLNKSAYGLTDLGKDVAKFNSNMAATEMIVEAAAEIAGSIALMAIPGGAAVASARLAASAARWGAKGVKVAKYANKAAKLAKATQKLQQGGKAATTAARLKQAEQAGHVLSKGQKAAKVAAKAGGFATRAAVNGGATFAATFGIDVSDGKSVKEAAKKALMNAEFAAVGVGSAELAPKIMQACKCSSTIAKEIAEEFINSIGSAGISFANGDKYGTSDAAVDILTGLIISRASGHFSSHKASATPDANKPKPQEPQGPPKSDYPAEIQVPVTQKAKIENSGISVENHGGNGIIVTDDGSNIHVQPKTQGNRPHYTEGVDYTQEPSFKEKTNEELEQMFGSENMSLWDYKHLGDKYYDDLRLSGEYTEAQSVNGDFDAIMEYKPQDGVEAYYSPVNGWNWHKVHGQEFTATDRISLSVKADEQMFHELDELMLNGRYTDADGNVHTLSKKERTKFEYKNEPVLEDDKHQGWLHRHDPITMYFENPASDAMVDAIATITDKYKRIPSRQLPGAIDGCPWMAHQSYTSADEIDNLIAKAREVNPELADAIAHKAGAEKNMSTGQYSAYEKLLEDYTRYKNGGDIPENGSHVSESSNGAENGSVPVSDKVGEKGTRTVELRKGEKVIIGTDNEGNTLVAARDANGDVTVTRTTDPASVETPHFEGISAEQKASLNKALDDYENTYLSPDKITNSGGEDSFFVKTQRENIRNIREKMQFIDDPVIAKEIEDKINQAKAYNEFLPDDLNVLLDAVNGYNGHYQNISFEASSGADITEFNKYLQTIDLTSKYDSKIGTYNGKDITLNKNSAGDIVINYNTPEGNVKIEISKDTDGISNVVKTTTPDGNVTTKTISYTKNIYIGETGIVIYAGDRNLNQIRVMGGDKGLNINREGSMADRQNLLDSGIGERQADNVIADLPQEARTEAMVEYITTVDNPQMKQHLYENYYLKGLETQGIAPEILDKCRHIQNEYNCYVFLSNSGFPRETLEFIDTEFSKWKTASNGQAKFPPAFDFSKIKIDWYDRFSAYGQGRSAAYSASYRNGYIAFAEETESAVAWALRHEMTHSNDLVRGNIDISKYNLNEIMPKKKEIRNGKEIEVPDMAKAKYVDEFRRAGIGETHIPYAYNNPLEFIAVASEGNLSAYSPEFRQVLIDFGMPEWLFNLDGHVVDVNLNGAGAGSIAANLPPAAQVNSQSHTPSPAPAAYHTPTPSSTSAKKGNFFQRVFGKKETKITTLSTGEKVPNGFEVVKDDMGHEYIVPQNPDLDLSNSANVPKGYKVMYQIGDTSIPNRFIYRPEEPGLKVVGAVYNTPKEVTINGQKLNITKEEFGENGTKILTTQDGTQVTVDSNNRALKSVSAETTVTYEYTDNNQNYSKAIVKDNNSGNIISQMTYDAHNGRITSTIQLDPKTGEISNYSTYDPQTGNLTETITYDPKTGNRMEAMEFNPETGNPTEINTYNPETELIVKETKFNSETGNPTEIITYNPETGHPVETMEFNPETGKLEQTLTYDPQTGNPTEATIFDENGDVVSKQAFDTKTESSVETKQQAEIDEQVRGHQEAVADLESQIHDNITSEIENDNITRKQNETLGSDDVTIEPEINDISAQNTEIDELLQQSKENYDIETENLGQDAELEDLINRTKTEKDNIPEAQKNDINEQAEFDKMNKQFEADLAQQHEQLQAEFEAQAEKKQAQLDEIDKKLTALHDADNTMSAEELQNKFNELKAEQQKIENAKKSFRNSINENNSELADKLLADTDYIHLEGKDKLTAKANIERILRKTADNGDAAAAIKKLYDSGMDIDTLSKIASRTNEQNTPHLKSLVENSKVAPQDIPDILTEVNNILRNADDETRTFANRMIEHELQNPNIDNLKKCEGLMDEFARAVRYNRKPDIELANSLYSQGYSLETIQNLSLTENSTIKALAQDPNIDKSKLAEINRTLTIQITPRNEALANSMINDILKSNTDADLTAYRDLLMYTGNGHEIEFLTKLYNDKKVDIQTLSQFAQNTHKSGVNMGVIEELYNDSRVADKSRIFDIEKDMNDIEFIMKYNKGEITSSSDTRVLLFERAQNLIFNEPELAAVYNAHGIDLEGISNNLVELGVRDFAKPTKPRTTPSVNPAINPAVTGINNSGISQNLSNIASNFSGIGNETESLVHDFVNETYNAVDPENKHGKKQS